MARGHTPVVAVSSGGGRQPRPAAPVLGPVGQELAAGAAACEAGGPQALPSVRLLGPLRSGGSQVTRQAWAALLDPRL